MDGPIQQARGPAFATRGRTRATVRTRIRRASGAILLNIVGNDVILQDLHREDLRRLGGELRLTLPRSANST